MTVNQPRTSPAGSTAVIGRHPLDRCGVQPLFDSIPLPTFGSTGKAFLSRELGVRSKGFSSDGLGDVVGRRELDRHAETLANRLDMQVVFQAAKVGNEGAAAGAGVERRRPLLALLRNRRRFAIEQIELPASQGGQPRQPGPKVAAAGRDEQQFTPTFVGREIRHGRSYGMQKRAEATEELDIMPTFDDEDQTRRRSGLGRQAAPRRLLPDGSEPDE